MGRPSRIRGALAALAGLFPLVWGCMAVRAPRPGGPLGVLEARAGQGRTGPVDITGLVTAGPGDGGEPLGGVEVRLVGPGVEPGWKAPTLARTYSYPTGWFALPGPSEDLEGDELGLLFRCPGYVTESRTVVYSRWSPMDVRVRMEPTPEELAARGPLGTEWPEEPRTPILDLRWRAPPGSFERLVDLASPLATGRNDGFHYLVLVPPFEGADVRPLGVIEVDYRYEVTGTRMRGEGDGVALDLDGQLYEQTLRGRLALYPEAELRVELPWASRAGRFRISRGELPLVPRTEANLALGDLVLGAKTRLDRSRGGTSALAGSLAVKLPSGDTREVLTSGSPDVAATLHGSMAAAELAFHGQLGWTAVGEVQSFSVHTGTANVVHWGLAAAWPREPREGLAVTFVGQVVGHTSAFEHIEPLASDPASAQLGVRSLVRALLVEAGLGRGLSEGAAEWTLGATVQLRY